MLLSLTVGHTTIILYRKPLSSCVALGCLLSGFDAQNGDQLPPASEGRIRRPVGLVVRPIAPTETTLTHAKFSLPARAPAVYE